MVEAAVAEGPGGEGENEEVVVVVETLGEAMVEETSGEDAGAEEKTEVVEVVNIEGAEVNQEEAESIEEEEASEAEEEWDSQEIQRLVSVY